MTAIVTVLTVAFLLLSPALASPQGASPFCSLGEEKWMAACEVRCTASWSGTSARSCNDSCSATPSPGWVIVDHKFKVLSESNGGHSVTRIAADQKFDYRRSVEDAYSYALNAAAKSGKDDLKGKIAEDQKSALKEAEYFASTHQMIRVTVNARAHGSAIDRKRGWSEVRAEMLCRCFAPRNLQDQLAKKYGLE